VSNSVFLRKSTANLLASLMGSLRGEPNLVEGLLSDRCCCSSGGMALLAWSDDDVAAVVRGGDRDNLLAG